MNDPKNTEETKVLIKAFARQAIREQKKEAYQTMVKDLARMKKALTDEGFSEAFAEKLILAGVCRPNTKEGENDG